MPELDTVPMYVTGMSVTLNHWFNSHAEARAWLDADGGYLLPYRHQYFVTTAEAIRELGLDPADPDWERIGYDWVKPLDTAARERLELKRRLAIR